MTRIYGLIGRNIGYSFSQQYFTDWFLKTQASDCEYRNFDLPQLEDFPRLLEQEPNLCGLNVTIPYKESIVAYLDELDPKAQAIGAVNVIKFANGKHIGYNSDEYGFRKSLQPMLQAHHQKALILGTGGASKAVAYALSELKIPYSFAARNVAQDNTINYSDINAETFETFQIWINCTPLGTYPQVDSCLDLPYENFTNRHLAYDLIYNPAQSLFLKKAQAHGAHIKNGLEMLVLQAEKAWEIWQR